MLLLPGNHVLDRNISVDNVTRLTMQGKSSSGNIATVVRNGLVGFSFTNMVDFNICSLAFTSYNRSWSYGNHPASNSGLLLQCTRNAKLVDCFFHDNLGTALTVHHTNITLTGNSEFVHNQCGCESFSERCNLGCAITAFNSTLTFTGNTIFLKNRHDNVGVSKIGAGAVFAVASSFHFTVTSNFVDNVKSAKKKQNHAHGGGAIYVTNNTILNFHGTNNFINNSANNKGGAIYASHNTVLTFTGTSNFISNYVHSGSIGGIGGAIYTHGNAVFNFIGTNHFINNSANNFGGAIFAGTNTLLTFIGTSVFSHNSAHWVGGAIYIKINVLLTLNGTNNFIHNSAGYYGGAIKTYDNADNVLTFTGTNNFIGNSVEGYGGGAISTSSAVLTFTGTNNFINNSANGGRFSGGGAISTSPLGNAVLIFNGTNIFTSNSAIYSGGAISADFNTSLTFGGTTGFSNNSANHDGGAIYVESKTLLKFIGISDFITNKATSGGAISTYDYVIITFTGTISFISNSAMQGGAISANRNSKLTFDGNISYINNGHANTNADNGVSHGGAIYLALNSTFSLLPHTTVCWENNHATLGGAIYVSDINPLIDCTQIAQYIAAYVPREECFFQLPGQGLFNGIYVNLLFKNNSADDAGSVLYGGAVDNCKLHLSGLDPHFSSGEVFDMLFQYEDDTDYSTTSKISSDPIHLCVCKNNLPNCRGSRHYNIPYPVYPGELFQLPVPTVTVGQRHGTVFSTVRSTTGSIDSRPVNLLDYQYLQYTSNICTKLYYTVFSLSQIVYIKLHPEGSPCSKYDDGPLYFSLIINQSCPLGFNISTSARSCVCEPRLAKYTNSCNITNGVGRITRGSGKQFWVGYDNSSHELILHSYCPFDYCVNDPKVFPLNNTDIQCAYNRSGLLCGHCKEGYSLVLGSNQCRRCTSSHLALLILFTLMGVALVFLLLACKLTVATGTLSGLLFYANIVRANRTLFLPVESIELYQSSLHG